MFRLSGDFIYSLAAHLRPIEKLTNESTRLGVYAVLSEARDRLDAVLDGNPLGLRASWFKGSELRDVMKRITELILADMSKAGETLEWHDMQSLKSSFTTFEVTLRAELSVANLYAATPKGAYDTGLLAEYGLTAFPSELGEKVPDAVDDAKQAARCIAFDLPTAAAFHLHRAHEAVIHAYFINVAPDAKAPVKQPLGVWIQALETNGASLTIVAALRDIATLHRNPVLHGGFNRSMQHTNHRIGGRSVANEAATQDLLLG